MKTFKVSNMYLLTKNSKPYTFFHVGNQPYKIAFKDYEHTLAVPKVHIPRHVLVKRSNNVSKPHMYIDAFRKHNINRTIIDMMSVDTEAKVYLLKTNDTLVSNGGIEEVNDFFVYHMPITYNHGLIIPQRVDHENDNIICYDSHIIDPITLRMSDYLNNYLTIN